MYIRKVIRISAADSPNVRYALAQKAKGLEVTGEQILPGVITYQTYLQRLATWDEVRICVSIHGEFYEGASVLMFPPAWLDLCEARDAKIKEEKLHRGPFYMGIDVAEGRDDTSWAIIDKLGLVFLQSLKTPNTSDVNRRTKALMREYAIEPENVCYDRGGGGRVHADNMRTDGYNVQDIGFGSAASPEQVPWVKPWDEKTLESTERFVYKNRRAQMYHLLRLRMDPDTNDHVFALPASYTELRRQLAPTPLLYDKEGEIWMLPKRKKKDSEKTETIEQLLGRSPDDADALVLANWAMEESAAGIILDTFV